MVKELGNLDLETLGLWDLGIYLFMNHSESQLRGGGVVGCWFGDCITSLLVLFPVF